MSTALGRHPLAAHTAIALNGYIDRLHIVEQPIGSVTERAQCGRRVVLIDAPDTGWRECRTCYPHRRGTERDMHDVWDACADLDDRYNGTIRDTRPLGSVLECPPSPASS